MEVVFFFGSSLIKVGSGGRGAFRGGLEEGGGEGVGVGEEEG